MTQRVHNYHGMYTNRSSKQYIHYKDVGRPVTDETQPSEAQAMVRARDNCRGKSLPGDHSEVIIEPKNEGSHRVSAYCYLSTDRLPGSGFNGTLMTMTPAPQPFTGLLLPRLSQPC